MIEEIKKKRLKKIECDEVRKKDLPKVSVVRLVFSLMVQ